MDYNYLYWVGGIIAFLLFIIWLASRKSKTFKDNTIKPTISSVPAIVVEEKSSQEYVVDPIDVSRIIEESKKDVDEEHFEIDEKNDSEIVDRSTPRRSTWIGSIIKVLFFGIIISVVINATLDGATETMSNSTYNSTFHNLSNTISGLDSIMWIFATISIVFIIMSVFGIFNNGDYI